MFVTEFKRMGWNARKIEKIYGFILPGSIFGSDIACA